MYQRFISNRASDIVHVLRYERPRESVYTDTKPKNHRTRDNIYSDTHIARSAAHTNNSLRRASTLWSMTQIDNAHSKPLSILIFEAFRRSRRSSEVLISYSVGARFGTNLVNNNHRLIIDRYLLLAIDRNKRKFKSCGMNRTESILKSAPKIGDIGDKRTTSSEPLTFSAMRR